jgi:release factor glutamine methyltransferase
MGRNASLAEALLGLDVRQALVRVTGELAGAGIDHPARDARLLVGAACGATSADLMREPGHRLDAGSARALAEMVARRIAHEPVSRILGARGFYGRTFQVTAATLDPRPATETLIEAALEVAGREGWRERPIRILDVGTGTGALLVTLLAELPLATGLGTDISEEALSVARANAERLGVSARSSFVRHRSLDGLPGPEGGGGTFDLLVSNPPYIASGEIAGLEADVRDYDPRVALDGGPDGLAIYREVAQGLTRILPEGWAILEVGAGQAAAVAQIFSEAVGPAHAEAAAWTDLGGHTRAVAVRTQRYPRR